ncbi:MAG: hypothetical protein SWJ54_16605 [Cyanobacteriota bacterium]|nr:hypothetical protein [Cyanobacteriota bacterium]
MPTKEPSLERSLRLWTVEDYHRMAEVGILQPDEPVELIAGKIIRIISPHRTPHSLAIRRTRRSIIFFIEFISINQLYFKNFIFDFLNLKE